MACVVCSTEASPYRCPQCSEKYCSVACYKQHKTACAPSEAKPAAEQSPAPSPAPKVAPESTGEFAALADDREIRELLRYPGLKKHLQLVARIVRDPSVSGETADEGRRLVAVKKLRELRKGGRESNEAVEQFCVRVAELSST